MSNIILEIDKPLTSSTNGEPMTATKASSSDQDNTSASIVPKAFSCSACSLQSYHLWVILRHIRNVHQNDGSNAKIIDNINNQVNSFSFVFLRTFVFYLFNRSSKIMMI